MRIPSLHASWRRPGSFRERLEDGLMGGVAQASKLRSWKLAINFTAHHVQTRANALLSNPVTREHFYTVL